MGPKRSGQSPGRMPRGEEGEKEMGWGPKIHVGGFYTISESEGCGQKRFLCG
jgi:hypothetical protein